MSSLKSFRSSGSMPLLALSAEFFLFSSALFIGIATMWQFLKRKISDEISACVTKIANDLSAHDTKINATFNAERGRMYAEINNKLTAEIGKIKARDDVLTKEAQKILSMVNNITTRLNTIEEACRNDFSAINASIENLQNEMIRQYAVARRIQPVETDQLSMADQSETSNQSHANSSGSSDSGPITFRGISLTIWTRFKQLFDQIRDEKGLNTEEICLLVAMEIRELGGKIKKNTIQGFYERNITKRGGYISTLDDIGLWVDSKNNENLDSNSE